MSLPSREKFFCGDKQLSTSSVERDTSESSLRNSTKVSEAGEEVRNLHKKLQEETDNIIRWKAATEVNIKQLQYQLKESQGIVVDLRRNLMELQMTNENLSQSLLWERKERELINSKVIHTREMLASLQQQCERLANTISVLQKEKEYHKAVQTDTAEQLQILSQKFKDLKLLSEDKLKNISNEAQDTIRNLEREKHALDKHMENSNLEKNQLKESLEQKIEEGAKQKSDLVFAEETGKKAEETCILLKTQIEELQELLSSANRSLEEEISKSMNMKEELEEKHFRLHESKSEFNEAVEKIQFLKLSNDKLEGKNSELLDMVEALSVRQDDLEQEVLQKSQVIERLKSELDSLLVDLDTLKGTIAEMSSDIQVKADDICKLMEENQELFSVAEAKKIELSAEHITVRNLQDEMLVLRQQLEEKCDAFKKLQEEQETLREDASNLTLTVKMIEGEIQQKVNAAAEHEASLKESITSMQNQCSDLRLQLAEENEAFEEKLKEISCKSADAETSMNEKLGIVEKMLQEERLDFQTQKDKLLETIENKEMDMDNMKQELGDKITSLEEELSRTSNTLSSMQSKYDSLLNDFKVLEEKTMEQEKEFAESKQKLQVESREELEGKILEIKDKNKELQEECSTLKKRIKEHDKARISTQKTFKEEKGILEIDLGKCKKEREELEKELKDKCQELSLLQTNTNQRLQKMKDDMQNLITDHNEQVQILESVLEKAIQEKSKIEEKSISDLHLVKTETDSKIKGMASLIERYSREYGTELSEAKRQIQDLQAQLKEAEMLVDATKVRNLSTPSPTVFLGLSSISKKQEVQCSKTLQAPKVSTVYKAVGIEASTPREYLTEDSSFRQPQPPNFASEASSSKSSSLHTRTVNPKQIRTPQDTTGILKHKRMLLPGATHKRVVFKLPSPKPSDDSSSDACSYEFLEEDAFDEILLSGISGRVCLKTNTKAYVRPQANVLPLKQHSSSTNEERKSFPQGAAENHTPLSQNVSGPIATKEKSSRPAKKMRKDMKTYGGKKSPGAENCIPPMVLRNLNLNQC